MPNQTQPYDAGRFNLQDLLDQALPELKTIRNELPYPYSIQLDVQEFSSYCPLTGHPDYATIRIDITVTPDTPAVVEQKSLRDFLNAFRTADAYQEEISHFIYDRILSAMGVKPSNLRVEVRWSGRGGISNIVTIGG